MDRVTGQEAGDARSLGGANCAKSAARDKNWNELGLEDKVERVRQTLLGLEHTVEQALKRGSEALKIAKTHQHSERGMVMTPVFAEFPEYIGNDSMLTEGPATLRHIFNRLR